MKRKLFFILVTFLVLAGFSASAQSLTSAFVTIQTGDSTVIGPEDGPYTTIAGRVWPYIAETGKQFKKEKSGYASKISDLTGRLTWNEKKGPKVGGVAQGAFVYETGKPQTVTDSPDRLRVTNPGVNLISIFYDQYEDRVFQGTKKLEIEYGNTPYSNFVVFRSFGTNNFAPSTGGNPNYFHPATTSPEWCETRVTDYFIPYTGNSTSQQIVAQPFISNINNVAGEFEGFLAVQTVGQQQAYVGNAQLLIVVHDKNGELSIISYEDYVETLSASLRAKSGEPELYPLYIKSVPTRGRWAVPEDFADCLFTKFGEVRYDNKKAKVEKDALLTVDNISNFVVKQVNYLEDGGIFKFNPDYEYGLTANGEIPLFTLHHPTNCKVVSVSRNNDNTIETQSKGGLANKLEFRDYGAFKYYNKSLNKLSDTTTCKIKNWQHTGTPTPVLPASISDAGGEEFYLGLQQFAIWIDEDGDMTIYPYTSYFWEYGNPKLTQNDDVRINSSLKYNNPFGDNLMTSPLALTFDQNELAKLEALKIGYWNGHLTSGSNNYVQGYIGTIPTKLQQDTDYADIFYKKGCSDEGADLEGRYFFIQVNDPQVNDKFVTGLKGINGTGNYPMYQYDRKYVLSTQTYEPGKTETTPYFVEHLVMVPKEQVVYSSSANEPYWSRPADKVNMAAHWYVKKSGKNTYKLVNMLGDTLKYDDGQINSGNPAPPIASKYITYNNNITGVFNPDGPGDVKPANDTYWYEKSSFYATEGSAYSEWMISKVPGENLYTMRLNYPGADVRLSLSGTWMNTAANALSSIYTKADSAYYQQYINLDVIDNSYLHKYVPGCTEFPAGYEGYNELMPSCLGLLFTLEEIDYVPRYGDKFYPGEPKNDVRNTNDEDFAEQDKLTAYTFLEGFFDIIEAKDVHNGLKLGAIEVSTGVGTKKVLQAALVPEATTTDQVEFIALSKVVKERNEQIRKFGSLCNGVDTLLGETYKWYVAKYKGKYLTFDTVNVDAVRNREKVGLVFDAVDLANATPVRFYQPLVGDKKLNNFLIQFYMPRLTYFFKANGDKDYCYDNNFPDIESNTGSVKGGKPYSTSCALENIKFFDLCFASIGGQQSEFLYAVSAYYSSSSGTRFTFKAHPVGPCCADEFITPNWLGEKRLLNLPLNNQLWNEGKEQVEQSWISTKAKTGHTYGIPYVDNKTIDKHTKLIHTYSGRTIKNGTLNVTAWSYPNPGGSGNVSRGGNITGFNNELPVDLYYIQNGEDPTLYLTVCKENDFDKSAATIADVNGVKLTWAKKIGNPTLEEASGSYYNWARQLFAISACPQFQPNSDNQYGKFIYLPLASYVYDYKTQTWVDKNYTNYANNGVNKWSEIRYNLELGKKLESDCSKIAADLTKCWRISQCVADYIDDTRYMVVFNAMGAVAGGNLTPLHVVLTRPEYEQPACLEVAVKNTGNNGGVDNNKFYTLYDRISFADGVNLNFNHFAHWILENPLDDDDYLYTFAPELKDIDGVKLGQKDKAKNTLVDLPTQLTGEYYFIKELGKNRYQVIDVSKYTDESITNLEERFKARFDTLTLTCVDHEVPYLDLNVDAFTKLAILEKIFTERNLASFYWNGKINAMTPVYHGKNLFAYRGYINDTSGKDIQDPDVEYVTVYPVNEKVLIEDTHVIPYYAFSITKGKVEYFLNIDTDLTLDSVYWTALDKVEKEKLLGWRDEGMEFEYKTFKFCLPYQMNANGTLVEPVLGCQPIYLQTLDEGVTWKEDPKTGVATKYVDEPYLVVTGPATNIVTSMNLIDAFKDILNKISNKPHYSGLQLGLYSMDYRWINPDIAAWVFAGEKPAGNLWVPIWQAINGDNPVEGALTDFTTGKNKGGVLFIDESGNKDGVNYGIMNGIDKETPLTLRYDGTAMIGTYTSVPIWYYRIIKGEGYLTDATPEFLAGKEDYIYNFNEVPYPYAYFGDIIDEEGAGYEYNELPVYADEDFLQSFGFRYANSKNEFSDDTEADQTFFIVSNANFMINKPEGGFRYLTSFKDRLVFTDKREDALLFQWGKVGENGYTGLQVVGKGGIFGVQGGVKLLNTTGKVDLFSIDGRLIKSAVLNGGETIIPASRGIVLVKNGNNVVKVAVQ